MFALCFGSVEGDGALMLGDADVAGRFNVALQYTPLLSNPAHPHYYSVLLEALVVGGEPLDVKAVRHPRDTSLQFGGSRAHTGVMSLGSHVCTWHITASRWRRWWSAASR